MLEKINEDHPLSRPANDALYVFDNLLNTSQPIIAEIGVGIGATSLALSQRLDGQGELHLFDFEKKIEELVSELTELGHNNVFGHGNSRKTYDGYSWQLTLLAASLADGDETKLFDFSYLDGAHALHQDGTSACALKVLTRQGGFILLDDYAWTYESSPSMNPQSAPQVSGWYTKEQLETPHVALICEAFFDTDPNWVRTSLPERLHQRALYQRIQ